MEVGDAPSTKFVSYDTEYKPNVRETNYITPPWTEILGGLVPLSAVIYATPVVCSLMTGFVAVELLDSGWTYTMALRFASAIEN